MEGSSDAGKTLTAELIIQKTKTDKFDKIKNINLWGNSLNDVSFIKELHNLEVVSLSVNKVTSLRDFAHCKKLTELYLRKNMVADLSEVQYLTGLDGLRVLWLWENPCAEHSQYRPYIIKMLPNLARLDNTVITPEERTLAQSAVNDLQNPPPAAPKAHEAPKHRSPIPSASSAQEDDKKREALAKKPRIDKDIVNLDGAAHDSPPSSKSVPRTESVLCAILSLLKELDLGSLEIIKKDVERKLNSRKNLP